MADHEEERRFGATTATMLVVASMVGTGVFTTTGFLVRDIGSLAAVLLAWALGGLLAVCGALAYAELSTALPANGGEYQLLSRIYHPSIGFVSGFTSMVVGFSAPIAAAAIAFGAYVERILPVPPLVSALGLIVIMSTLHAVRVELGSGSQNAFTIVKVCLIVIFVAAGAGFTEPARIATTSGPTTWSAIASPSFAIGLIYVSYAYSGWNAAAYVAGEVRRPSRNLPLALLGGTIIVTGLYLGLNWIFLTAAPADALSGQVEIAHVAASHLFGPAAGKLLSTVIALGLISTVGALVMTGPRIYEAMGRDYPRLRVLSRRERGRGPVRSIALQAGLAIVMVLSARFDELLTYIGFTLALFSALTVAGVFVLRHREPELPRPYRTWGYPVTPLVSIGLMLFMVIHAFVERPVASLVGLLTLGVGLGLYALVRPSRSAEPGSDSGE